MGCVGDTPLLIIVILRLGLFFFSSRRRHTRSDRDWSSDVCSSDLARLARRRSSLRGKMGTLAPGGRHCEVPRLQDRSSHTARRSPALGFTASALFQKTAVPADHWIAPAKTSPASALPGSGCSVPLQSTLARLPPSAIG